jgi:CRP-like cAMP-binding protein
MISDAIIDLLMPVRIFDSLDEQELRILAKYMNHADVKPGEILFKEGEIGTFVSFIAEGELDVYKKTDTGKHVRLTSLTRGMSIGEMALIDNFPRSATVRARKPSTLVTLSRDSYERLIDGHPKVGIKVLKGIARLLSQNLRHTSATLADYMHMLPVT